jgi:hypothetical protein
MAIGLEVILRIKDPNQGDMPQENGHDLEVFYMIIDPNLCDMPH